MHIANIELFLTKRRIGCDTGISTRIDHVPKGTNDRAPTLIQVP